MKKVLVSVLVITLIGKAMESNAQSMYRNENNVAINGYDVVNYFTDLKAVKGTPKISKEYQGSTFYFATEAHKKSFEKNPAKYMPQFDGYCAYAVATMDKKVPTNPETFKIVEGKLYLFFNDLYEGTTFNTLTPWNQDEDSLLLRANKNWKGLKKSK